MVLHILDINYYKTKESGGFLRGAGGKILCALVYHNPLVGGPNPSAATRINKRPDGSFFYSVRRGGDGHPDGGPTRRQKADGSMPVPRSFNEGGFAQGNEAQRNQSTALLPKFKPVLILVSKGR